MKFNKNMEHRKLPTSFSKELNKLLKNTKTKKKNKMIKINKWVES
jgi:hypothetical protein